MQTIYYGAPGTGKSYTIKEKLDNLGVPQDYIFRTTFHPEYSYTDFVGQLLPTVDSSSGKDIITYSFSKGIFTKALEKAYEDTSKNVYLILEEMSRGNSAAILGDIFQLLDREDSGIEKGYSKYFINNSVISRDIIALPSERVLLPPNLYIIGTVNTSDQNVFVMDTAFKRRFDWEYVSTKPIKDDVTSQYLNNPPLNVYKDGASVIQSDWVTIYSALNEFISSNIYLNLGEDKQLGHFFINFTALTNPSECKKQIKNKLLQFLWDDVSKASFKQGISLFKKEIFNYADLYSKYENDEQIFSDQFLNILTP